MNVNTLTLTTSAYPSLLKQLSDPPKAIYYQGPLLELLERPRLAVVGSRKVSAYGRAVTLELTRKAAEQGIVIISGLALGVDSIAHQAALEAHTPTIAVLPASLERIYPASHSQLAKRILEQGGALVSEYPHGTAPFKHHFIARNRIISALSDGVLLTEAAEKSGSLHTANFALEQGRTVMAVPGNITSVFSRGTNNLIKSGAVPVTDVQDILTALGMEAAQTSLELVANSPEEAIILKLIRQGTCDGSELLSQSELTPAVFNQTLTLLEIQGNIRPLGNGKWALR